MGAIVAVGATPILIDCDERFQINVKRIEEAINIKTKAIIPVHWGGASPDMEAIMDISIKHNILVVEDACMGIGVLVGQKAPGTFGKVNAFSMHPLKSLNVMGDGGMVVTNDDHLACWIKKYRNHGMIDRDHIEFWGVNMRLQPLQAIVASHRLDELNNTIEKRNFNAAYLDKNLRGLSENSQIPLRIKGNIETFALYMALFDKRDELKDFLISKGVEVKIHYPIPLHKQTAAQQDCLCSKDLKISEDQANKLLTIPVHQYLQIEHMQYVVEKIKEFYNI